MDLATTPLFGLMRERMAWLAQRQRVLAENIANADTPRFRPRDIAPFVPAGDRTEARASAALSLTQPGHIAPAHGPAHDVAEEKARTVYEATPSGNAVVLEEQMAKVNETAIAHRLAAQVYRKYLGLVRLAASAKG
ncbi:MAG: flagellar basal body protein [Defluviicoccus sp.]